MKKLIALAGIAVLTLSLSGVAIAQTVDKTQNQNQKQGQHRQHRHGALKRIVRSRLADQLALTAAQKEKIKVLNQQFKAQLKGLKDSKNDRDAKKGQFKAIAKQHRDAILNVLTPEQKAKLEALKKDRKDRIQKRRIGRAG